MTLLDPRVWIVALLVLAGAFVAGYHRGERSGKATVQAAWDADKLKRSTQALADIKEVRATEQARTKAAADNAKEVYAEQQKTKRSLAAERANAGELRDALAARIAADKDRTASDPAFAAGPDGAAASIGRVLETCRAEASSDAAELEDLATQVRGLIRAYLSLSPQSPP